MSITSDLRSYADTAVNQGKQALGTAQAQLNDYTGQANDLVGRYTATTRENVSEIADKIAGSVTDVRHSAEKAINLDAITAAVEPYLAQLKEYTSAVTDKVEDLVAGARSDKRVNALVQRVEPVVDAVVELAQERVVKPVQSLTGLGAKPAPARKPAPKPTAKTTRKPAATKPAAKSTARPAARKTAAKRTATS